MPLWALLPEPRHIRITLTIAALWFASRCSVTPCLVKNPGERGGQARCFGTKNEVREAFLIGFRKSKTVPKEMALEWFISCFYIHFFSLSYPYAFSHTVCSSWNTLPFLPVLCISADFSQPLRPSWDVHAPGSPPWFALADFLPPCSWCTPPGPWWCPLTPLCALQDAHGCMNGWWCLNAACIIWIHFPF